MVSIGGAVGGNGGDGVSGGSLVGVSPARRHFSDPDVNGNLHFPHKST